MKAAIAIPVTVKCRIGVDEQDPEAALAVFAGTIERAGADALIVHARKAWLKGLSPKGNREVPPLDYDRVYRLKAAHPRLAIVLNGGIASLAEVDGHLDRVDGVMIGRAAYQQPWRLLGVDPLVFGDAPPLTSPRAAAAALMPYIERELADGTRLHAITRHLHGLFQGVPGARAFRRRLAEAGASPQAGAALLVEAIALVKEDAFGTARVAA
jgi:tRNA-dihydrouridine synthase A